MPQKFKNLKTHEAARLRRMKRKQDLMVRSNKSRMPKIYKAPEIEEVNLNTEVKKKQPLHKRILAKRKI